MYRRIRNKLLKMYKWIRLKVTNRYTSYLCGPMTSAVNNCNVWRKEVTDMYRNKNVYFVNPVDEETKKTGMELQESISKFRGWQRSGNRKMIIKNMEKIKKLDLRAVISADFIVAFWDNNIPTIGTVSEMDWAEEYDIPIYTFTPNNFSDINPWLFFNLINHSKCCVAHTLKEVCKAIDEDFDIK